MTEPFTSALIVALPAEGDPISTLAPGQDADPHITLCWFGPSDDLEPGRENEIRQFVADIAGIVDPFEVPVSGTDTLGDDGAKVLMLESEDLIALREFLASAVPIRSAMNQVEQFPSFTPHLTWSYDEMPASPPESVQIDRLGLWLGERREEFPLGESFGLLAAGQVVDSKTALTPDNSDVPPLYLALTDAVDKDAVLDVLALVPASADNSTPIVYSRANGGWQLDDEMRRSMLSTNPPPIVQLDAATAKDVIKQVDTFFERQGGEDKPADEASVMDLIGDLRVYSEFGELYPVPTEAEWSMVAAATRSVDSARFTECVRRGTRSFALLEGAATVASARHAVTSALRSFAPVDVVGVGQVVPVLADGEVTGLSASALANAVAHAYTALPPTGRRVVPIVIAAGSTHHGEVGGSSALHVDLVGHSLQMVDPDAVPDTAKMVQLLAIGNGSVGNFPRGNMREFSDSASSDPAVTQAVRFALPDSTGSEVRTAGGNRSGSGVCLDLLGQACVVDRADTWVSRHEMQSSLVAAGGMDRNRGSAEKLRRYWTTGPGGAKIRWNSGGDWYRCVKHLSKYLGPRAKGYCQLRHKEMTGMYTSTHAKMIRGGKKGGVRASAADLAEINAAAMRAYVAAGNAVDNVQVTDVASPDAPEHGARFRIPLVVPEGVETGDGRRFAPLSLTTRELPLPLLWQLKTAEGHDGSVIVGRIDNIERIEGGLGDATGVFDVGPYGREVERLVRGKFLRGISADLDKFEATAEEDSLTEDGEPDPTRIGGGKMLINKARVSAITVVARPAFEECTISLIEDDDV